MGTGLQKKLEIIGKTFKIYVKQGTINNTAKELASFSPNRGCRASRDRNASLKKLDKAYAMAYYLGIENPLIQR